MKTYFSFGISGSMFRGNCAIYRCEIDLASVKAMLRQDKVVSCCNSSHVATIDAMRNRFGINIDIPDFPPNVILNFGDKIIVMGVIGLPRLFNRHEYTKEEVASADFTFAVYIIAEPPSILPYDV